MGNMREISAEECGKVSGGIIIVDGYPPTPGGGGNDNSGTDGAVMYLNMNSTIFDYSHLFGQNPRTVSENPEADGDYDGDGIPDSIDNEDNRTIEVTAFSTEHMNSLRDQAQQITLAFTIMAGIGTGGIAWEAGIIAFLTRQFGPQIAGMIIGGATPVGGALTEDALTNFFVKVLADNDKKDFADDGKINRSTWMTPDARGQVAGLVQQWNDLNTPNPDPEPGDSDWE